MFGYIAINKAEMKFKDYDTYHAYYCGLCKRLKEKYGRRGQLTLSYDMTFLIVLLTGLYEPIEQSSHCNCVVHPFQKHATIINEYTDYAADMNLILSYYKCKDDWNDEKKKKGYITAKLLHSAAKNACCSYPKKATVIGAKLKEISKLEVEKEENIDLMAGLFGDIMAEIFAYREDEWAPHLHRFGFFLGKFIYLMDAYEDVEADISSGSYNPLKNAFKREDFDVYCKEILTMMIAECSKEFERLPVITHAEILRNVLYSGVWCRFEAVSTKRKTGQEKENG